MTTTTLSLALKGGALILLLILIYTGIYTGDRTTWIMEVTPVIIIVPLLLITHQRYPLTPLLYTLIFFHAIILMVGGMYTYAKVPIGFEVQEINSRTSRLSTMPKSPCSASAACTKKAGVPVLARVAAIFLPI
jgi:uncharacterized membrane protein YjdF